jgi:fucose permease
LQGIGLLLAAPFLYVLGVAPTATIAFAALAGFGLFRGIYDASIYAGLYDVVPARFHSSASSVMIAFAYVVGALAPVALGRAKAGIGLSGAICGLSLVFLTGALASFVAARFFYSKDHARAIAGN